MSFIDMLNEKLPVGSVRTTNDGNNDNNKYDDDDC
jgi:hypothetical protein